MNSAAATANTPSAAQKSRKVSPEILQDILYEILANGMDPCETRVSASQIENFLFEHARAPKPAEAFLEFFNQHGLSINPEDHIKPLELKALHVGAGPAAANPPALPAREKRLALNNNSVDNVEPLPLIAPEAAAQPDFMATLQKTIKSLFASPMVWAAAASLTLALAGVVGLGYSIATLKAELNRAQAAQRQSQQAVVELQQRLGTMQSDVALNGQSIERLEPQIDLLVGTLVPPTQPAQ